VISGSLSLWDQARAIKNWVVIHRPLLTAKDENLGLIRGSTMKTGPGELAVRVLRGDDLDAAIVPARQLDDGF